MILSEIEKERYNRHLIIDGFAEVNQLKLTNANVLVIGAGGLGCPVIQYLVAAGVGKLGIVDGDVVSLSNLQRQILFSENEIGQSKADISAFKMSQLNSNVTIHSYNRFLDEEFADKIFSEYDIIVGCTDNYNSRYIIDKYSIKYNVPFVHGSIQEFEGQLCVFNYHGSCSYTDFFGELSSEPMVPVGVIGALPGIIGSLMALETIKIITNQGDVFADKLLIYNSLTNVFQQYPLKM